MSAPPTAAPLAAPAAPPARLSWIEQRLTAARAGHPEAVRLTVWKCWGGCTCPSPCLTMSVDEDTSLFVDVLGSHGHHLSMKDDASQELVGHFTGKTRSVTEYGEITVLYEIARDAVIHDVATSNFHSTGEVPPATLLDGGAP